MLPPLPKTVPSLLGPLKVRQVKKVDKEDSFGKCFPETRTIRIKKGMDLNQAWHTLRHEWFHFVFFDNGIHTRLAALEALPEGQDFEEHLCDVLATAMVSEMLAHSPSSP